MHHDRIIPFTVRSRRPQESDHHPCCGRFVLVAAPAQLATPHSSRFAVFFNNRLTRLVGVGVAWILVSALGASAIGASAILDVQTNWKSKDLSWNPNFTSAAKDEARGIVGTKFQFHPVSDFFTGFPKLVNRAGVNGPPVPIVDTIVHTARAEDHKTTGTVKHDLFMRRVRTFDASFFDIRDMISAKIVPGTTEDPAQVSVRVGAKDPWSFGTAAQGAVFDRNDSGFDALFSLSAGTAFPASVEYGFAGADELLGPTVMEYAVRVAPGVVNDPDAFWESPEGAIDLYRVRISSDNSQAMSVDLHFGQSTSQFVLNFIDSMGNPFDPTDPLALGSIRQQLLGAFVDGEVLVDLSEVFGVGFVPLGGLDSYTTGFSSSLDLPDLEVPAPGFTTMLLLGGILASRQRRQICLFRRDQP